MKDFERDKELAAARKALEDIEAELWAIRWILFIGGLAIVVAILYAASLTAK